MANNPLALLVDFDEVNVQKMSAQLRLQQFHVVGVRTVLDANIHLDELTPDLAIIALDLPDGDGLTLLKHPGLDNCREIILINDEDDPPRVRQGLLAGASYFFCRLAYEQFLADLFKDLAVELRRPDSPLLGSRATVPIARFGLLHGSSPAMHKLYRSLRKLAPSDANVLLIGESGTGKELIARTIHQLSERSPGPFVALNCGSLPAESVERELFGHETEGIGDADRGYLGYLERAHGGTLFLDEITELSSEMQTRLLHTLETNRLQRIGGSSDVQTDLRIVAATSRASEETGHARRLREDLYFRIASLPLHIPPLRTRGEDIQGLAQLFLSEFNQQSGTEKTLSRDATAMFEAYTWPGNIRELRSVVERAYLLAEQDITPDHLPDLNGQPAQGGDVLQLNIGDSVQDAEKKLTLATLTFYNGDKRKAAQTLGVSLKTLYNRINAYQADKRTPFSMTTPE